MDPVFAVKDGWDDQPPRLVLEPGSNDEMTHGFGYFAMHLQSGTTEEEARVLAGALNRAVAQFSYTDFSSGSSGAEEAA
jgi:hypothetical protein